MMTRSLGFSRSAMARMAASQKLLRQVAPFKERVRSRRAKGRHLVGFERYRGLGQMGAFMWVRFPAWGDSQVQVVTVVLVWGGVRRGRLGHCRTMSWLKVALI